MVAWLPLLVALGAAARVPVVTTGGADRRTVTQHPRHPNGRAFVVSTLEPAKAAAAKLGRGHESWFLPPAVAICAARSRAPLHTRPSITAIFARDTADSGPNAAAMAAGPHRSLSRP